MAGGNNRVLHACIIRADVLSGESTSERRKQKLFTEQHLWETLMGIHV